MLADVCFDEEQVLKIEREKKKGSGKLIESARLSIKLIKGDDRGWRPGINTGIIVGDDRVNPTIII